MNDLNVGIPSHFCEGKIYSRFNNLRVLTLILLGLLIYGDVDANNIVNNRVDIRVELLKEGLAWTAEKDAVIWTLSPTERGRKEKDEAFGRSKIQCLPGSTAATSNAKP